MKSLIITLTLLLFLCFCNSFRTFSQTDIFAGNVSGNWEVTGSPYRIFGDLIIPNDSSLKIDAGVNIEFQGHYSISVQGNLQALGSVNDSIHFTINDTTGFSDPNIASGGWNGIRIVDVLESNDSSIFEHCVFNYGKAVASYWYANAGGAICIIQWDKVRISHCLFNHNSAGGTEVPAGGAIHMAWSAIKLNENVFINNRADEGGAIQIYESDPSFIRNIFANNSALVGGGITIGSLSNPTFDGDSIIYNTADQLGGGMMCWNESVIDLTGVVFVGNESPWGAGLGLSSVEVYINECIFQNNVAEGLGGGIASDFSDVSINNSAITYNTAGMSGGIHAWYDTLEMNNCEINNNIADNGSGMHAEFSQLKLTGSKFSENQAVNGGGLQIWNCDLDLNACEFRKNHVMSEGGAIESNFSDTLYFGRPYEINVKESQFIENNADFRFGAIKFQQTDTLMSFADIDIDQCIFDKNHAERIAAMSIIGKFEDFRLTNSTFSENTTDLWNGGASFSQGCTGQLVNCIFADNHSVAGNPGASGVSNGSYVHYINCTFVNNTAGDVGGLSAHRDGIASITNCIFWNNSPKQLWVKGLREDAFSEMYVNYCDIQYGADSIGIDTLAFLHWGLGNFDQDPKFYDPDNGDFHLLDDSPCIDTGIDSVEVNGQWLIAPESDLEGYSRPQDGATLVDIGAYENQDVLAIENESLEDNTLMKVYPNPFKEQLNIEIKLKHPAWIVIRIYDFLGSEVAELMDRNLDPGIHQLTWDAKGVKNGMFICRIQAEDKVISSKIFLTR